jgi:hypothetical protein
MNGPRMSLWRTRCNGLRAAGVVAAFVLALVASTPTASGESLPVITYTVSGTIGSNNWYRSDVTVAWTVTGTGSLNGCGTQVFTAETASTPSSCSVTNSAGTTSQSINIKIDKTAPTVATATPDRSPDSNGWYNHAVGYSFGGSDALSGVQSCTPATYGGPDGESATVTGSCRDLAGNVGTRQFGLRFDATAPSVAARPARAPDANGWYNHPVSVAFAGSDGASGLDSCTSASYGGPDSDAASVGGSCRDRAGNARSSSFSLRYDATPPVLSDVVVTTADGADSLAWKSTSAADTAVVRRVPRGAKAAAAKVVFSGAGQSFRDSAIKNGLEYVYSVQSVDQAGNASAAVSVRALPKVLGLQKLSYVPRVSQQPVLRWRRIRGATYYHVQLFRGGKRILAAWPVKPQLTLPQSWSWKGHRYRLQPATYRWYVWAGKGRRSLAHYSRLGKASFTVVQQQSK